MQIMLTVTTGPHAGREFTFDGHDNFIVGRSKAVQFRLSSKDQFFSRNHFLVEVNPPLCRLLDLNSTNGTHVNGKPVTSIELNDGDTIEAGDTTLRVSLVLPAGAAPHSASEPDRPSQPMPIAKPTASQPSSFPPSSSSSIVSPQWVGDQTLVPRGWTALRTGTRGDGQIASIAGEAETIAPRGFRHEASDLDPNPVIAVTFAPATRPAPNAGRESTKFPDTASRRRSNLVDDDHVKIAARPQPFAGYEIIEELGRGGMGVVYRARCLASGSLVALKVVLPAVASSPDDLARFVREASIVKELNHPHIVPFRDLGHAEGQLFFVMDYVPGVDGQVLLRHHAGPLPVLRAIGIACQLLEALSAAHRQGYVHRDVKPSNLLIETRPAGDYVWLADFGLARAYQASKLSGLTTTGNIGGTLPYMAPEQITHYRDVTPAADQYSAAATLYHLLTGRHLYDFPKEVAKQLLLVLQEPPHPIQNHRSEISDKLAAVIHKGLARVPSERFVDVETFRVALLNCR